MLDAMPLSVFYEWMAYDSIDPIGAERDDWRASMVACTIANANRGKRSRTYKVKDFMPTFGPRPVTKQSCQAMKANLMMFNASIAAAQAGKVKA